MRFESLWLMAAVAVAGCAVSEDAELGRGSAELRVDAAALTATLTRVVVDDGATAHELAYDPQTNQFQGTLILAAGPHELRARAFSNAGEIGASRPTPVTVDAGGVTRVAIRILDSTTSGPSLFGPIVDSVVHPGTAEVGTDVTFAISVVAPAGDPVAYAWQSTCAGSVFDRPAQATTRWRATVEGPCTITALATSNGITVAESFLVVALPAGGGGAGGAVIEASFVSRPLVGLGVGTCYVQDGGNASCGDKPSSPEVLSYGVGVGSWGGAAPGTFTFTDDCGGRFARQFTSPDGESGYWLPPLGGGLCIFTGRAESSDGLVTTQSLAILTRPGAIVQGPPPTTSVSTYGPAFCSGTTGVTECGVVARGESIFVSGVTTYPGHAAARTITDDCGGTFVGNTGDIVNGINGTWQLPADYVGSCTLTIHAETLESGTSDTSLRFSVFL